MSWITDRLSEKTSQAAIATALTATGVVASNPASYGSVNPWLSLVPLWIGSAITICLPEAGKAEEVAPVPVEVAPVPVPVLSIPVETSPNA